MCHPYIESATALSDCIDISPKSIPHNEFIMYWYKGLTKFCEID